MELKILFIVLILENVRFRGDEKGHIPSPRITLLVQEIQIYYNFLQLELDSLLNWNVSVSAETKWPISVFFSQNGHNLIFSSCLFVECSQRQKMK